MPASIVMGTSESPAAHVEGSPHCAALDGRHDVDDDAEEPDFLPAPLRRPLTLSRCCRRLFGRSHRRPDLPHGTSNRRQWTQTDGGE